MPVNSFMIDPAKLNQLAMQFDPAPVMKELGGTINADGSGFTPSEGSYTQMLQAPGQTPPPGLPPIAPQMMASMMPQQQKQPQVQAPAVAPKQATPVKIEIPDISNLMRINLGPQQQAPAPNLATLLQGGR